MSNVVAFNTVQNQKPTATSQAPKSMTLFVHIKRTTLIAHCGNLQNDRVAPQDCVSKSRH